MSHSSGLEGKDTFLLNQLYRPGRAYLDQPKMRSKRNLSGITNLRWHNLVLSLPRIIFCKMKIYNDVLNHKICYLHRALYSTRPLDCSFLPTSKIFPLNAANLTWEWGFLNNCRFYPISAFATWFVGFGSETAQKSYLLTKPILALTSTTAHRQFSSRPKELFYPQWWRFFSVYVSPLSSFWRMATWNT